MFLRLRFRPVRAEAAMTPTNVLPGRPEGWRPRRGQSVAVLRNAARSWRHQAARNGPVLAGGRLPEADKNLIPVDVDATIVLVDRGKSGQLVPTRGGCRSPCATRFCLGNAPGRPLRSARRPGGISS